MLTDGGGGGGGHFTLTCDPESMIAQGPALDNLSVGMTDLYNAITKDASGLGDVLRGQAADSFEVSFPPALQFLQAFATSLSHASESLTTLGNTYSTAVTTTLPSLNQQWDAAVAAHDTAVAASAKTYADQSAAANTPHDATTAEHQQTARDNDAANALSSTQASLTRQFTTLHDSLVTATKKAASELSELVEGESLYEAIDHLNTKIGSGLNPAATALMLPEVKALHNLLETSNALSRANATGAATTLKSAEDLAESLARGEITPEAAAARMLRVVSDAAEDIKTATEAANEAGKVAGAEGGLSLLAKEGSGAAKALDLFAHGAAGLAIFSDVLTIINPGDEGTAHGWVTRTMALGNIVATKMAFTKGAQSAATDAAGDAAADGTTDGAIDAGAEAAAEEAAGDTAVAAVAEGGGETVAVVGGELLAGEATVAWVPVAGQVLVIGTGLYLAGDYLYQNTKWFHDGVNDAAKGVEDFGKGAVHDAEKAGSAIKSVASDCNPFNW